MQAYRSFKEASVLLGRHLTFYTAGARTRVKPICLDKPTAGPGALAADRKRASPHIPFVTSARGPIYRLDDLLDFAEAQIAAGRIHPEAQDWIDEWRELSARGIWARVK